ncbi:MAG: NifB/NifX family molybdenum-iron cluster-binding protein [FCB group bacterium]|nr:NifB/NifX family molybdenum-iron cluster-binding protein [FCB group bacterium]
MRIAVATLDDATITGHFRNSTRFAVFDAANGAVEPLGIREYGTAAPQDRHQGAVTLLHDCNALVCGALADRIAADLQQHGIEPVVAANCETIPVEAARLFAAGTLPRGVIHPCCCGGEH